MRLNYDHIELGFTQTIGVYIMLDSFFEESAPPFRLRYNVSPLIDIPNGTPMTGPNGETYFCGGMQSFGGIAAKGNTFKSTFGQFISKRVLSRYDNTIGLDYDTEETIDLPRVDSLTKRYTGKSIYEYLDGGRFKIVNKASYSGNVFYDKLKNFSSERSKKKSEWRTVPFVYRKDTPLMKVMPPVVSFIDSFSQFATDSVEKIQNKADIGESERNTEALRDAGAKDQMVRELGHITVRNNFIVLSVAHVGDKHSLNPMEPPTKQFAFLKQGLKLKNVPEKYTFLTNNLWAAVSSSVLNNQTTRAAEYPRANDPETPGDTDLNCVYYFDLRSKGGSSGVGLPFVFSQREGFLEGLTYWNLLKEHKAWGLIKGHNTYACEILPDVFASRKQVRDLLDSDYKFFRAVELTASSRIFQMFHPELYYAEAIEMNELYKLIKDAGYDWDRLLSETRSYWTWVESEKAMEKKPLSIIDLYRMARGTYHPWWYGKKPEKVKLDPNAAIKALEGK